MINKQPLQATARASSIHRQCVPHCDICCKLTQELAGGLCQGCWDWLVEQLGSELPAGDYETKHN